MTHHASVRFMSVYPALLLYLAAGSALQPVHTTMLMRGVSSEQSQSTERRGEWSWTRSAMGNDNINN